MVVILFVLVALGLIGFLVSWEVQGHPRYEFEVRAHCLTCGHRQWSRNWCKACRTRTSWGLRKLS